MISRHANTCTQLFYYILVETVLIDNISKKKLCEDVGASRYLHSNLLFPQILKKIHFSLKLRALITPKRVDQLKNKLACDFVTIF